jgi:6,7-dimethyl-8-ribityllumazine synthase
MEADHHTAHNARVSTSSPTPAELRLDPATRIALIASRWNDDIVARLLDGCTRRLAELGHPAPNHPLFRVPGAYELPAAARVALAQPHFHAVICLGCVIRGETWHFEAVAGAAARGILDASLATNKPAIFGVLTVESHAQALARSGGPHGHAGTDAANAAAEMLQTLHLLQSHTT